MIKNLRLIKRRSMSQQGNPYVRRRHPTRSKWLISKLTQRDQTLIKEATKSDGYYLRDCLSRIFNCPLNYTSNLISMPIDEKTYHRKYLLKKRPLSTKIIFLQNLFLLVPPPLKPEIRRSFWLVTNLSLSRFKQLVFLVR